MSGAELIQLPSSLWPQCCIVSLLLDSDDCRYVNFASTINSNVPVGLR